METDGIVIRPVEPEDGPRIVDLERRAAVVAGDERFTIDRGDDYFAATRLMESVDIVVAEVDGEIVAVHCAAFPMMAIGGVEQRANYIHHLRIAPEYQRRRLLGRIKEVAVPRYAKDSTTSYAYVDVTNPLSASMRKNKTANLWTVFPVACEVDVRLHAGRTVGAAAAPPDAAGIVEALNAFHGDEELWRPLTVDLLAARLERDVGQYTWSDVWTHGDAIIGVWPIGQTTRVITEGPKGRTFLRQAVVLDYSVGVGAERKFGELVRASCTRAADLGLDRLVFFTYEGSRTHRLLAPLAVRTRKFDLWTTAVKEPEGTAGVHVDPIYF